MSPDDPKVWSTETPPSTKAVNSMCDGAAPLMSWTATVYWPAGTSTSLPLESLVTWNGSPVATLLFVPEATTLPLESST